jgi:energy-coupling factor transporter ATP-binding protein EcfA2
VGERFADLAAEVLARPARLGGPGGRVRVVAVDGPSGAGKTTVAGLLAGALAATGATVEVVHTDDLLDGWDDLVTFWERLEAQVLAPLRAGRPGGYRTFDWLRNEFGAELQPVPLVDILILEGVTSARRAIRSELSFSIFVTAPDRLRLSRVLARDGAGVLEPLLTWRRAEAAFHAEDGTAAAVDVTIDGSDLVEGFLRLPPGRTIEE